MPDYVSKNHSRNFKGTDRPLTLRPSNKPVAHGAENSAQACLLKMTARKRRLIRAFEALLVPAVWIAQRMSRRHGPPATDVLQIVVVEYWNIGDIVVLLPFLENLRAAYPTARLILLANPTVLDLLKHQNFVDEIIPFTTPWSSYFSRWHKYNPFSKRWIQLARTLFRLRRRKFSLALSGRMDIRDNFLIWLIGARQRIGYAVGGGGLFLTDVVVPDVNRPHRSSVWLQLLRHLGKKIESEIPQLRLSETEKMFAAAFLRENQIEEKQLVVGVHAGARIATRRWDMSNFVAVSALIESEFKAKILWFTDPANTDESDRIPSSWIRVALPFGKFIAVLNRCNLLTCNDSGPMHLAAALGVPVVAVFGPTQPIWFGPLGPANRVVIRPEFWCRPCFDYCIFEEPYCIRTITVEEVFKAAAESLRSLSHDEDRTTMPAANTSRRKLQTGII